MNLEGRTTRLRALEPGDIELMYAWENDTQIWGVSGTLAPFSRHTLERFIEGQQFDIFQTRQQRLKPGKASPSGRSTCSIWIRQISVRAWVF